MSEEHQVDRSVAQELSPPEIALKELNRRIWAAGDYFMSVFFIDDTWEVRQSCAYGNPILDIEGESIDNDWEKENQLVHSIVTSLGDRVGYYEAAYAFPDALSALGEMTKKSWVEMLQKRSQNKPKSTIAQEIFDAIKVKLEEETVKFESFLDSADFRNAFTIQVNKQTGEYEIQDLQLDADELRAKWQGWFGTNPEE